MGQGRSISPYLCVSISRQGGSVRAGCAWLCACGASGWGVGVLVVSIFNIFRCAAPAVHGQGAMAACAVRASRCLNVSGGGHGRSARSCVCGAQCPSPFCASPSARPCPPSARRCCPWRRRSGRRRRALAAPRRGRRPRRRLRPPLSGPRQRPLTAAAAAATGGLSTRRTLCRRRRRRPCARSL